MLSDPDGHDRRHSIPHLRVLLIAWRCTVPFRIVTPSGVDLPVTRGEAERILERDHFRCRYCGLDGKASFENALVLYVEFVVPRARKGKNDPSNLVACCRACSQIKGTRVYRSFEDARKYVLDRREELRHLWAGKFSRSAQPAQQAEEPADLCAGL